MELPELVLAGMRLWQVVSQGYAQSTSLLVSLLLKYQSPTASAMVCQRHSLEFTYWECVQVYVMCSVNFTTLLCILGESTPNHVSWDSLWQ